MPENIIIKSDELTCVARGQAVVEARQPIEGAFRVLSASATAVTTPSEIFAQEARYVGKVTFDFIIATDDRVECVSTVAEFSDKITSSAIGAGSSITLVPEIVNVEAAVEGGGIKAVAVVDVTAFAVVPHEYSCLAEPDDGIYADKRSIDYCTVAAEQSETAYVTDSIAATKISDILTVKSHAVVTSVEVSDTEVKVGGTVYTDIIVRDDDGMISCCRAVTPFVKGVGILGAASDGMGYAVANVTESSATIVDGRVDISVTMTLGVTAFTCNHADVVADVFCADTEIEPKTMDVKRCIAEPLVTVTDAVDGQIPLAADKLAADNVLCVTGKFCTISSATIDGRANVEGLIGGDIIYYNAEKNAVDSLAFRLPFSLPLSVHSDATSVEVTAKVTDITVRVRRESVFDIKAEVAFTLRMYSELECGVVESVVMGEPIARPNASVIIHIAKKGETLWQAAKALCCSPDRVTAQNDAQAPYEGGERLINFCNR